MSGGPYTSMETIRAFAAVEIRPNREIVSLIEELKSLDVRVKTVEPNNMHLTIKFFGNIGEKEVGTISEGMKAFSDMAPFEISLSKVGAFPSRKRPKVIWIGVEKSERLEELWKSMEEISAKAGIPADKREFSPHLTIGRVKGTRNPGELRDFIKAHEDDDFNARQIKEIKLKKSQLTPAGPVYSDIFTAVFRGGSPS